MQLSSNAVSILAFIADCYTPILLIVALRDVICHWLHGDKLFITRLIYAAIVVYFWMFADKYLELWATLKLDYSTHSAAAFVLVVIVGLGKSNLYKLGLVISLVSYGLLMYLLGYHSWGDMASTVFLVGICLIPIIRQGLITKFTSR